jgi:hypothetical protein
MIGRLLPRGIRAWVRRQAPGLARSKSEFDASQYWESRYARGGTSGEGSYGRLAEFKAAVLNDFVAERKCASAIEFGCGDGNQLSLLIVPKYIGLDVSRSAIQRCIERFRNDASKCFFVFDADCFRDPLGLFHADLALSLDVIYHVVDDDAFRAYMSALCAAADEHLVIYSTDYESKDLGHQRHRAVSSWMAARSDFEFVRAIDNPYAGTADGQEQSDAKFLIYRRVSSNR